MCRAAAVDARRVDDERAVDAQETAVQLCLPLRNAGFGAVGEAPGGVNPHFAVVRFDVADFRGVERDFAAVGDETDRTGVGTAAFEVFFESYFRSDEDRQDQQDEGRVEQQPRHSAFVGAEHHRMAQHQREVFDAEDRQRKVDGVEDSLPPVFERQLRHEVTRREHSGQEQHSEQEGVGEEIPQTHEDKGDDERGREPPDDGQKLFHAEFPFLQI